MVRPSKQLRDVTEDLTGVRPIKQVTKVAPIKQFFLVEYYDGRGDRAVQVVGVLEGTAGEPKAVLFPENLAGKPLATPAAEWFNQQLAKKIAAPEISSV